MTQLRTTTYGTLSALLLMVLLLAGCSARPAEVKSRAGSFTNPVYVGTADKLPESADPSAIKYNGEYYAYVTGDPCMVLKSGDMVHWQKVGPMLAGTRVNCWAPDVHYKNGIFYAIMSTPTADGYAEVSRRVRVYTSSSPTGPFTLLATLTDFYSYDGHYFEDASGQGYLYWTQECSTLPVDPCVGNATAVDKMDGMTKLSGHLTAVASPAAGAWECMGRCILEAPAVHQRDGLYYMLYSGGAYENETYGQGYARSTVPMGTGGHTDTSWTRETELLKSVEVKVDGPGGASWIVAPNNLEDWLIYHGRGFTPTTMDRWLRIDPVMWGREELWVPGGPSYDSLPAPAMPAFRDLFDRPDQTGLGKDWQTTGGAWTVTGGQAHQPQTGGTAAALSGVSAGNYLLEANVRFAKGATGAAGVYAFWRDEKHQAEVLLDRQSRQLVFRGTDGEPFTAPLPADFNFEVYHQLLVAKNGDQFGFTLDGRPMGRTVPSQAFVGAARTGLVTEDAAADFDGVALTEGWDDNFKAAPGWGDAADGRTKPSGEWVIDGSTYAQKATSGIASTFKGSRDWKSFSLTASFRLAAAGGQPYYGLYAGYYDSRNYVQALIDPKAGTLVVRPRLNGKDAAPVVTPLKGISDFGQFHTLRVTKNGFTYTFFVDGQQVASLPIPLSAGQPGLCTENAQVQFAALQAVRWD